MPEVRPLRDARRPERREHAGRDEKQGGERDEQERDLLLPGSRPRLEPRFEYADSSDSASRASVNAPPVISAIAFSVSGSGGTGMSSFGPPWPNPPNPRLIVPSGVPRATVYTG